MKFSTVKEFRDKATQLLKEEEPILITRHGHLAGIYMPMEENQLSLKRELQSAIGALIRRAMQKEGIREKDILRDFERYRKSRRRR